ncbi:MAG TPA: RHS repeat-associated core domain-containing protein, partial [Vitreimonas sp.]|nr:RHS repeat-associated core domain-containing protein [Vitreimonas sp.]
GFARLDFAYDGEGHRTQIKETTTLGAVTTTEFRYDGERVVGETVSTGVTRTFTVDEAGAIVKVSIAGDSSVRNGDYLVVWNGHGDAMGLWRIKGDGSLEKANTYAYSTWGSPSLTTSHPNTDQGNAVYGDLGFRYLYVGRHDVQWDNWQGAGLHYMHARHYSPALGRFLQPDPDRSEANLYAYAANNPVTEIDPDGTCFIVCAVVGAVLSVAIYAATTEKFDLGEAAKEAAVGGVLGMTGVGLISKIAAGTKLLTKVSKASRVLTGRGRTIVGRGLAGVRRAQVTTRRADAAAFRVTSVIRREVTIVQGRFRIAPLGNKFSFRPHYHRARPLPNRKGSIRDQGMTRHRPWDVRPTDRTWVDRW